MISIYYFLERTFIYNRPQDQEVNATIDVVLECGALTDARESAQLSIMWKRNGDRIDFETEPRFLHDATDDTLTIIASEVGDSGNYSCLAENGVDSDEVIIVLTVNGKDMCRQPLDVACVAVNWKTSSLMSKSRFLVYLFNPSGLPITNMQYYFFLPWRHTYM